MKCSQKSLKYIKLNNFCCNGEVNLTPIAPSKSFSLYFDSNLIMCAGRTLMLEHLAPQRHLFKTFLSYFLTSKLLFKGIIGAERYLPRSMTLLEASLSKNSRTHMRLIWEQEKHNIVTSALFERLMDMLDTTERMAMKTLLCCGKKDSRWMMNFMKRVFYF